MVIGLISDTHGLLRESALRALRGVEIILHAGDVGDAAILEELGKLAPVVAVRGNVDTGAWAEALPVTAVANAGSGEDLHAARCASARSEPGNIRISHGRERTFPRSPGQTERDGVLYINPGSAGPRRFNLPITVARLDLERRPWQVEFIDVSQP